MIFEGSRSINIDLTRLNYIKETRLKIYKTGAHLPTPGTITHVFLGNPSLTWTEHIANNFSQ